MTQALLTNYYNYYLNNILSYFRVFKQKSIQYLYIQFLLYQKRNKMITNEKTNRIVQQSLVTRVSNHFNNIILDPTHIVDGVYLGNAYNASNTNTINKYNIKSIVNVTCEIPNYYENAGIEYYNIEILDNNENNFTKYQFDNVMNFMENAKCNILVHCYMGSSRSATIIVLYLMRKYKYSLEDAIEFVRNKRDIVNINKNFVQNLEHFGYNNE